MAVGSPKTAVGQMLCKRYKVMFQIESVFIALTIVGYSGVNAAFHPTNADVRGYVCPSTVHHGLLRIRGIILLHGPSPIPLCKHTHTHTRAQGERERERDARARAAP